MTEKHDKPARGYGEFTDGGVRCVRMPGPYGDVEYPLIPNVSVPDITSD